MRDFDLEDTDADWGGGEKTRQEADSLGIGGICVGEPKEFANSMLDQWLQHRSRKMARPHMRMLLLFVQPSVSLSALISKVAKRACRSVLAIAFVHPEHRRRGAAKLLVGWGCHEADLLGIEAFCRSHQ